MIVGTICLVSPLIYLMHVERCVATLLAAGSGTVEAFLTYSHPTLAYGVAVVGAIVLLVSTGLVALMTVRRLPRKEAEEDVPMPSIDDEPPAA